MNSAQNRYQKAVFELQSYLRTLSFAGYDIPLINPDGIYGSETAEAVRQFQSGAGLDVTGKADTETWNAVYAEYCKTLRYRETFLPPDYTPYPGEVSDSVYIIQVFMRAVSHIYDREFHPELTGKYDSQTVEQVRRYQKINRLPQTGIADPQTHGRLWDDVKRYAGRE